MEIKHPPVVAFQYRENIQTLHGTMHLDYILAVCVAVVKAP